MTTYDRRPPAGGSIVAKIVVSMIVVLGLCGCLGIVGCVGWVVFSVRKADQEHEKILREERETKKNPIVITATELAEEYRVVEGGNSSTRFWMRYLRVEGEVKRIAKNPQDDRRLNVVLGNQRRPELPDVVCVFGGDDVDQAAKLKAGDVVTVIGQCRGKFGSGVHLEGCQFAK
jgi:hypothetical protein